MAMADRTANTVWEGGLAKGNGTLSLKSGATDDLPVTWASRTERSDGKTSPGGAHRGGAFLVLLDGALARARRGRHEPERLDVTATVTLDEVDGAPTVTTSKLTVRGQVPGHRPGGVREGRAGRRARTARSRARSAASTSRSTRSSRRLGRGDDAPARAAAARLSSSSSRRPARAPRGTPPAGPRCARPASCASCPPSGARGACACGRCRRRSTWT